jgi:hypothetical protein
VHRSCRPLRCIRWASIRHSTCSETQKKRAFTARPAHDIFMLEVFVRICPIVVVSFCIVPFLNTAYRERSRGSRSVQKKGDIMR